MTGAINFLQDAIKVCDSRRDCDGCPCVPLCKHKESLAVLPKESLATLVGNVSAAARAVSDVPQSGKALFVTRYNEEQGCDGEPGNGGRQTRGVVAKKEESVRIPAREVDAYLTKKCEELLERFHLTDADRVPGDPYDEVWDDGLYRVRIRRTKGTTYPVSDWIPGVFSTDGIPHEKFHTELAVSLRCDGGWLDEIIKYVPESLFGIHAEAFC